MSELADNLRCFGTSDEGLVELLFEAADQLEALETARKRLRNELTNMVRAVDWCRSNDPDRLNDVLFDAAERARAALGEKE